MLHACHKLGIYDLRGWTAPKEKARTSELVGSCLFYLLPSPLIHVFAITTQTTWSGSEHFRSLSFVRKLREISDAWARALVCAELGRLQGGDKNRSLSAEPGRAGALLASSVVQRRLWKKRRIVSRFGRMVQHARRLRTVAFSQQRSFSPTHKHGGVCTKSREEQLRGTLREIHLHHLTCGDRKSSSFTQIPSCLAASSHCPSDSR